MFPTGHFLLALVPVTVAILVRRRRLPARGTVGLAFFGSQFPDLIDKPLAHQLYLLPSGRVFMHSLPVAVPIAVVAGLYGWQTDRLGPSAVFVFAYGSHIVADNYRALTGPEPRIPPDMLWPFVPPTPRPIVPHWAGVGSTTLHLWGVFSVVVLAIASYFLYRDVRLRASEFRPD